MTEKVILHNIGSLESQGAANTINSNFQKIERALRLHLARDDSEPNAMLDDINLNNYQINNVGSPTDPNQVATKGYVDSLVSGSEDVSFLTEDAIGVTVHPFDPELEGITSITLSAGDGLTGGGDLTENRSFAVGAGTGIVSNSNDVAIDKASDANVRTAASNKVMTTDLIESASAGVAITNQTPATWDWDSGINFSLTVSQNTQIATPSNGQPGTWRTILVQGNDTTDRTITFSGDYEGEVPTITDCDNGRWYLLMVYCVTASHFVVSSKKANGT